MGEYPRGELAHGELAHAELADGELSHSELAQNEELCDASQLGGYPRGGMSHVSNGYHSDAWECAIRQVLVLKLAYARELVHVKPNDIPQLFYGAGGTLCQSDHYRWSPQTLLLLWVCLPQAHYVHHRNDDGYR